MRRDERKEDLIPIKNQREAVATANIAFQGGQTLPLHVAVKLKRSIAKPLGVPSWTTSRPQAQARQETESSLPTETRDVAVL
jgi:hypothetical protein